jgi:hypothetical protein
MWELNVDGARIIFEPWVAIRLFALLELTVPKSDPVLAELGAGSGKINNNPKNS